MKWTINFLSKTINYHMDPPPQLAHTQSLLIGADSIPASAPVTSLFQLSNAEWKALLSSSVLNPMAIALE